MKRRDLLTAAAALAAGQRLQAQGAGPAFAADDLAHAERLRELGSADIEAWKLLQQLCTEVGARPAGSPADAKAVAWAQVAMQRLGLQNVRAEPLPVRVWRRGPASARLFTTDDVGGPIAENLVMVALGNSVGTGADPVRGEIAWYADFAALKADTSDRARGRIVFIDQKTERWRDGRGYGAAVVARSAGAVEAAKRGALALGIRSIGTDTAPIAHTGAMRYELGVPRIPAFAVSIVDAERLAARQAQGRTQRIELSLDAESGIAATTHNVIGEVAGTDLADEVVMISAHLDSWDLGQGAVDDGAGVAIVTAAAALLQRAGRRPRRTVRVVLFANEENGFDGALAYGERYKQQVHQMVAESDFGAGRVWQLRGRVQPAAAPLVEALARTLAPLGVGWPDRGGNEGTPGPDAALLMRRHRWPALQFSQDGTHYFDVHHTVHDTLDRVDPSTLPQNVACWASAAWLAAQSPLSFGPTLAAGQV